MMFVFFQFLPRCTNCRASSQEKAVCPSVCQTCA